MSLDAGRVGVRADQVDIHGRVTSPSFLNELLEDLPEWTDMPVWVNGTEELLPSNNSVPVTSPILADIAYPDIRRDNQYFTYRESPTPVDGLAKIKSIKGNTLVWNQLVGRTDSYTTSKNGVAVTITGASDKNISLTAQGTVNLTAEDQNYYSLIPAVNIKNGHKYLLSSTSSTFYLYGYGAGTTAIDQQKSIFTSTRDVLMAFTIRPNTSAFTDGKVINETFYVMFIDLTQMFGSGNEPTTVEEFTSLFPLPYYDYNAGTLLSFNGTGVKTVGFNQWDEEWEVGGIDSSSGQPVTGNDRFRSKNFISLLPNVVYYAKIEGLTNNDFRMYYYDANKNFIGVDAWQYSGIFTTPSNALFGKFVRVNKTTYTSGDICINISDPNRNGQYEPYTSSTLSLPVSTYFPTGMKSAGNVYDELLPTKAITRIGAVDLGSLDWIHRTEISQDIFSCNVTSSVLYKRQPSVNFEVAKYNNGGTVTGVTDMVEKDNMTVCVYHTGNNTDRYIYIKDTSFNDATAFKNSLQGVYLYYELATPVELPTLSFGE